MKGVEQIFKDIKTVKELGVAKLVKFSFSNKKDPMYNIRANSLNYMTNGDYIKLYVNGHLVMSDTRMEKITNQEFVDNANGNVFIAGLGVGLIIENLRDKVKSGEVKSITVCEKSQDVIDLVSPYYEDLNISYICEDILTYKTRVIFDTIYFDIWSSICSDNLDEMSMLHKRWSRNKNKNNPNSWMGSWMHNEVKRLKRREQNERY